MAGPLHGLRVIELAGKGPVPHAGMVLADLGATVVLVQRPGEDHSVLTAGGPDHLLRGRQVIEVDIKSETGRETLLGILEYADIFIEGFRPGVAERVGLGPDVLLTHNPRLIYGRITGWGRHGPLAQRAGHDINYLALTGVLHALGDPPGPPVAPLNLLGDFGGGSMLLLVGILAALWERAQSGQGQVVDAAMVDGVSLLAQMIHAMRAAGSWRDERASNLLDGGAPFYATYACADGGYVAVGALEPQFYAQLLLGLGLDTAQLPEQLDAAGWPRLRAHFRERFASKTREEWVEHFADTDACVTPVLSFGEAHEDEHLHAWETFAVIDGAIQPAPAPRFSRSQVPTPHGPSDRLSDAGQILATWSRPDQTPR